MESQTIGFIGLRQVLVAKAETEKAIRQAFDAHQIWKESNTLHVNLVGHNPDSNGCSCDVGASIEQVEETVGIFKDEFAVDEIVFHDLKRRRDQVVVIEVNQGQKGIINDLPGAYLDSGVPQLCRTCIVIKGFGMRWEFVPA